MSRAPFQVLILPYLWTDSGIKYAVFQRSDADVWQGIAGGGEAQEIPIQAAQREAFEEAGISVSSEYTWIILDSLVTIPVNQVAGFLWGPEVRVIPEYTFGVELKGRAISVSAEHKCFCWCDYETAHSLLTFESNRNALWELNQRLTRMELVR